MTAPWFPVHLPPRSFAPSKDVSKMTSRKSPCTPTTVPLDPKGGESVDPANTTLSPREKDPPEKMAIRPPASIGGSNMAGGTFSISIMVCDLPVWGSDAWKIDIAESDATLASVETRFLRADGREDSHFFIFPNSSIAASRGIPGNRVSKVVFS